MLDQAIIECPYCSAKNSVTTVKKTRESKWSLKIYSRARSSSNESVSAKVDCVFCKRKYEFMELKDYQWLRTKLQLTDSALEQLKKMFPIIELDQILSNITGIARPHRRLGFKKTFHVCLKFSGKRGYLDCRMENTYLNAVGAVMV